MCNMNKDEMYENMVMVSPIIFTMHMMTTCSHSYVLQKRMGSVSLLVSGFVGVFLFMK
jgi:hypothetical protein